MSSYHRHISAIGRVPQQTGIYISSCHVYTPARQYFAIYDANESCSEIQIIRALTKAIYWWPNYVRKEQFSDKLLNETLETQGRIHQYEKLKVLIYFGNSFDILKYCAKCRITYTVCILL
mgnify:CR=1 FL=1